LKDKGLSKGIKIATMQDLHDKSSEVRYLLQEECQEVLVIKNGKPIALIRPYSGEKPKGGKEPEKILGMTALASGHVDLAFLPRKQGRALLQYHGNFIGVVVPVPEEILEVTKETIAKELETRRI
jgi:hypothetical protein